MKEVHLHFSNAELQLSSKRNASLDLQLDYAKWPQQSQVTCTYNAKRHAVFRHGSMFKHLYTGISAKKHDLYLSGELLGSITVITINRSFHRIFSKLKNKHFLMLTTLLKCSWAENTVFK